MSAIQRYISDPHFAHTNMALSRGFSSAEEHDQFIIDAWNSVVKKSDTTWILGDITMEKNNYEILNKLKGYKRIVLGNHDMGNHSKYLYNYVNSIHGVHMVRDKIFGNILLTHCPIHEREFIYRVNYNMHGHIHDDYIYKTEWCRLDECDKKVLDNRYINVCMEVQNYIPKSLTELIKIKDVYKY